MPESNPYRDHPLMEGFLDKSDSELIDVTVAQLDYACYVSNGLKTGLAPEVQQLLRDQLTGQTRYQLERWCYHAIVNAVKSDKAARERDAAKAAKKAAKNG